MEKEFLDKLKNRCDSLGIDIDILGDSELLLIYNGTTFNMQYYVWDEHLLNEKYSFISKNIQK